MIHRFWNPVARICVCLLSCSILSTSLTAEAAIVFSENFESYTAGTDITGQGGWFHPDTLTEPINVRNATGLPTQVLDGTFDARGIPIEPASLGRVSNNLPATLSDTEKSVLTFDAYAQSGGPTAHNTSVGLHSAGLTTGVNWQIESPPQWIFTTPGGNEEFAMATIGGFNEIVAAEIWIDPVTEKTWGVLTTGSGTFTTSKFSISAAQIASLTFVTALVDYRNFSGLIGPFHRFLFPRIGYEERLPNSIIFSSKPYRPKKSPP